MCGIMGYYAFGRTMPDKKKLEDMFILLETRGTDASGFAFVDRVKNNLRVTKAEVPASKLIESPGWQNLQLPKIMIFHTRMMTKGKPSNNMNNHPIFNKKGLAIVHNGMIYNDNEIFKKKTKRDAEVDSEAILAVLGNTKPTKDPIKEVFEALEGGFAVASIDKKRPDVLTLFRKDNPIDLYYNSKDDILYFCSEREIMQEALKINHSSRRGFSLGEEDYNFYEIGNNHALVLNDKGVETYKEYTPKVGFWDYGFDEINDNIIVECPYCLGVTHFNWGLLDNRCEHCGMPIEAEGMYV